MSWTQECLQCGYLISGDDTLRGRQVACPRCKQPVAIEHANDGGYGLSALPPEEQAALDAQMTPPEAGGDFSIKTRKRRGSGSGSGGRGGAQLGNISADEGSGFDLASMSAEATVQVPCPNGHMLETVKSMMGQWAMCPHCGEKFELSYTKTQQYKSERSLKERQQIARSSNKWLMYSIIAVVGVVLFLVILIAASSM